MILIMLLILIAFRIFHVLASWGGGNRFERPDSTRGRSTASPCGDHPPSRARVHTRCSRTPVHVAENSPSPERERVHPPSRARDYARPPQWLCYGGWRGRAGVRVDVPPTPNLKPS